MSEPSSQEPKEQQEESNPLDLSDLKSFSFGTEWTDAGEKTKDDRRTDSGRSPGRHRRPDRRKGGARKQTRDRRPERGRGPAAERREGPGRDSSRPGERSDKSNRGRQGGFEGRQGRPQFDRPYESAVFDIEFYPDDDGFATIIKALRANHITYELFEVARIFLEKSERYVASVTRKAAEGERAEQVAVAMPDGMPFETAEEAIQHVISNHVDAFFDQEEIETEPPSGNFPFVNRCGLTETILGPPNYHRYEEFVSQHFQNQISSVSFERFQSAIVQDRDEEAVNEWRESMKKTIRYSTKTGEGGTAETFDTLKEAVVYLRTTQRDKMVKTVNYARVPGVTLDKFPNSEASRAVSGELARQRRFPLKTANLIRGRLRREKFSIYKRGSKGVTYICAAKRNFRKPGQVMSDSLDRLIHYVEDNANVKVKDLPSQYESWLKKGHPDAEYDEKKLFQDLHWLIADGYITHFADDSLIAQPILDEKSSERNNAKEQPKREQPKAASKVEEMPESSKSEAPERESVVESGKSSEEPVAANSVDVAEAPVEAKNEKEDAASGSETDASADEKGDAPVEVDAEESLVAEEPIIESPELADTDSEVKARADASSVEEESKASESEPTPEEPEPSSGKAEADIEAAKVRN